MTTIKGNLILEKDTTYEESLTVEGSIFGKGGIAYNLTVKGDINAWDINAADINAGNINAGDIDAADINALNINAGDIDARNINAWDINAYFILCETLKQRKGSRLVAKNLIEKRSTYERKELKKVG